MEVRATRLLLVGFDVRHLSIAAHTCLADPEKFDLALRYGEEGPLREMELSDSDRLLLYALSSHAQHGPCTAPYVAQTSLPSC